MLVSKIDHDHLHRKVWIKAANQSIDFQEATYLVKNGMQIERATAILLSCLTVEERLSLLDGDAPFWSGLRGILLDRYNRFPFVMGEIERLGIPGIRFTDGPRGIVMHESTCFPVAIARGATWDVELEQRVGDIIGQEGRAQGANLFAGICINLPRHPAWGRIQETYGEDPLLLGEFGVALHRGVQKHLMTCVKHFALNSMENARFKVDVSVDDASLHEVYLPHFRRLVEEGVDSVMSSYNSVRGDFAGQNHELLNEILREQWGFKGFVLSDFIFGLRDAVKSVINGLDIEAPFQQQRRLRLRQALQEGTLSQAHVDTACMRILRTLIEYAARTTEDVPSLTKVASEEHLRLARTVAARSMVLLKNEVVTNAPNLPLDTKGVRKVALVGRLANRANTGDRGSSAVFAPHVVTFYEGLRSAMPDVQLILEDSDNVEQAKLAAQDADATICIVGYDAADEGEYVVPSFVDNPELVDLLPPVKDDNDAEVEAVIKGQQDASSGADGIIPGAGGDRRSLRLRERDVEIIKTATEVCPRTIVGVVGAGAIIMDDWVDQVSALLMVWYSGAEGGHALADVLLGKTDASGRLPFSIPRSEAHLPYMDIDATAITYDRWFGQRKLDREGWDAQFPLGYGISYTTFEMSSLQLKPAVVKPSDERFAIAVNVKNTGQREGRHVLQVYGCVDVADLPRRVLLGFCPVDLSVGGVKEVDIQCSLRPLQMWQNGSFALASGTIRVELGSYSGDTSAIASILCVEE